MSTRRLLARKIVLKWSSNFCRSSVTQLRVSFNRTSYFGFGEFLLLSECLGLNTCCRNALFDQETLGAVNAPFGKCLIVFHRTARIGMAFKSQASIRLTLEIGLEITCELS